MTALPKSTVAVERIFSKISNNKTKLCRVLSVRTIEAIVRTSNYFSTNFDVDDKFVGLYAKARGTYIKGCNGEERSPTDDIENLN